MLKAWTSLYKKLTQYSDDHREIVINDETYDVQQFKQLHLLSLYMAQTLKPEDRITIEDDVTINAIEESRLRQGISIVQQLPKTPMDAIYMTGSQQAYCQELLRQRHQTLQHHTSSWDVIWVESQRFLMTEIQALSTMLDHVIYLNQDIMVLIRDGVTLFYSHGSNMLSTAYLMESIPDITLPEIVMSIHLADKESWFVEFLIKHLSSHFFTSYVNHLVDYLNDLSEKYKETGVHHPLSNLHKDVVYLIEHHAKERYLNLSTDLAIKLYKEKKKK